MAERRPGWWRLVALGLLVLAALVVAWWLWPGGEAPRTEVAATRSRPPIAAAW
ncbi:MAG: hypothetical protein H0T76_06705, partial [Nannocystis sp.]|nr:hypothetical protein [Nannocystis sp.]